MAVDPAGRAIRRTLPKWDAKQSIYDTCTFLDALALAKRLTPLAERDQDIRLASYCPTTREQVIVLLAGYGPKITNITEFLNNTGDKP